jgi:N6-adenosine-specific RNA methylase IME4
MGAIYSTGCAASIDEFYELVRRVTPGATRCDVFSRETRPGFDAWGDEAGKFDAAPAA